MLVNSTNSTQIVPRSQHEDDSALLRHKMEELNKNTVRLIAENEKLIQESKQLSERIKFQVLRFQVELKEITPNDSWGQA